MTREIKFRAWDGKRMISWYEIGHEPGDLQVTMIADVFADASLTFLQYTGLTDKNGAEVYEGDVYAVKLHPPYVQRMGWQGPPDCVGVVFWDLDSHRLRLKGVKDQRYVSLVDICDSESEVIGNIYENPELFDAEESRFP